MAGNMDRGRNLEALAEEDDEEEMEEEQRREGSDSESSTSDDDAPDEGIKRGEPNKFDILCDGVTNAMALVHTALEELLDMKDEMLKHALPPTLLIKLATTTGKVFRGVSDLNMPVNELIRLVRVYSTPWEEKSAALKKLHEDYEAKQRQLNIAIKRLQLVDAHSKRIAREKRVMNWEKLFAKVMSNKGHGRRWKFLIETIKQKAKLGLEHVQEFTRQLDEESDEEEDDMPIIQLKSQGGESPISASDKVSEGETEQEEDEDEEGQEAEGDKEKEPGMVTTEVPSIMIEDAGEEDEDDEEGEEDDEEDEKEEEALRTKSAESKKVRFAESVESSKPKVEMKDAEVWTHAPEYDEYLFVRVYNPTGVSQIEIKCSIAFGKQFYKTKLLDEGATKESKESEPKDLKMADIKKRKYEEAQFTLPPSIPPGVLMFKSPVAETPPNCQITVHSGPKEAIVAMATIDIKDLKELDLPTVFLPSDHGDDDLPKTPEPNDDDDLDSLSSEMEIPLPGNESKKSEKPVMTEDLVKDSEPMMFPLYSLDGSSTTHKPCGSLPLLIYWAKRPLPNVFNRQVGTHGVNELVFELTGIDLETTSKLDLNKVMVDDATSVINFSPDVLDRAISAPRFTPENRDPPNPPSSPDPEPVEEDISPEVMEETIAKFEYDKMVEKHSKDMLFLQEEYEKRLQTLINSMQQMEQAQQQHQQQLHSQQKQIQEQQKLLQRRGSSARQLSPQATMVPPGTPAKKGSDTEEVSKPIVHAPMPPQKPRKAPPRKVQMPKTYETVPDEFLDRLQYFEDESYRHKIELMERTRREIEMDIEKKLAGQHKLSRKDEEMFQALNDVSLPALFMPFHRGTVFNPRAHQYFHPTGSSDLRLSQPPSVFQLPPLHRNNSSVLNLFELSKNFNSRGPGWLMDRYLQQQEPVKNAHGVGPQTSMPTSHARTPMYTPQQTAMDFTSTIPETEHRIRHAEAEC